MKCSILYKKGFTLAELLITFAIIGVVATLTIPRLITTYDEKIKITQVKKVYSQLSNAFSMASLEHGNVTEWFGDGEYGMYIPATHQLVANNFIKHLRLSENCVGMTAAQVAQKCGFSGNANPTMNAFVVLADGVLVSFRVWGINCNYTYYLNDTNICGSITVYLEPTKTYQNGYNTFNFFLAENGIIPYGIPNSKSLKFEKACNMGESKPYPNFASNNMYSCAAWVIYKGNMDYLHCNDLSWSGKDKCSK